MLDRADFLGWSLGVSAVVLALLWWFLQPRKRLPPGPYGLPLIGYLPFLGKEPEKTLKDLGVKYGNVFSICMGREICIFLNDYKSAKEAFNDPHILNRPQGMFDVIPDGLGLLGLNGDEWVEQRRYSMKALKDIGLGKSHWEDVLEEEVEEFVEMLSKENGRPVEVLQPLMAALSNNVVSIILGRRLLQGDPKRTVLDEAVLALIHLFSPGGLVQIFPKLMKFLSDIGLSKYAEDFRNFDKFNRYLRSEVDKRKCVSKEERDEGIFIDGYLAEVDRSMEKSAISSFSESNLVANAQALIVGGSETGTTSLRWLFLAMAAYPDVQERVYAEIDRVLGRDGHLKYAERNKLPYTYATIMEAQRWRTVVPLGVPHRTSADTTIGNFEVPIETNVFANIFALHTDPVYWKNPDEFDPGRFLNPDGTLMSHRPESYAPFSLGRRSCPGEMIALMEIFHYFTSILQKFKICTEKDGVEPVLEGELEATHQPQKQRLRYLPRE